MNPRPIHKPPSFKPRNARREADAVLADQPVSPIDYNWYEEFAAELARVQRGQRTVTGAMQAVKRVRDKWLRRGLHWPTLSRIMDNIVSLPFEMKSNTGTAIG